MNVAPVPSPDAQHPKQERNRFVKPFEAFIASQWGDNEAPPYHWIVENCYLAGTVAMLSGDGGLGKSLLKQMLCTAAAVGQDWLGLKTKRCKTFAMFCEDDRDELQRRQDKINRHFAVSMADLDDFMYSARAGMENILMEFSKNNDKGARTPIFDQLANTIRDFGAQIIVIDTVADTFGGNEIMRSHVRRFIGALRSVAMEQHGVVILTSHPSLTGLNSGSGISGSTAWNNSVRSRLYLTRPKRRPEDEGDDAEDTNERILRTMKNNSAAAGGKIPLQWQDGVFVRTDQGTLYPGNMVDRIGIENAILDAARQLIADGVKLLANKDASNSLANQVRKLPKCKAFKWALVASIQEDLLAKGRLQRIEMGPPSRCQVYVRPSDVRYPGEIE